ncbi:PREDICTED: UPF0725 protein At3g25080-like [Camelina sativa]|uniref:UPF0725 protein At3g25080-like n=1 Tax=Camelina sativa TaxID=90675 RepID=A0ABM0SUC7_CAMSA|nr:PREDICTED: UPF0725 protein At3g25080-like [Camelina sativa]
MSSAVLTFKNPEEGEVLTFKNPKEGGKDLKFPPIIHDWDLLPNGYTYSKDRNASRRVLVSLYARLGLHRYNFLMGKDVQLGSVMKYTMSTYSAASAYRIYFKAEDPAAAETTKPPIFEAEVDEIDYGQFILVSYRSGPYPAESKKHLEHYRNNVLGGKLLSYFEPDELLPGENPFQDDTGRFHLLEKSEVLKNEWIRLYLELAVATTNRHHIRHGVGALKIHKVAMEIQRDLEPFHIGLGAYDATFYIKYTDDCKDRARAGDDGYRVAIVRRIVDVHTGIFRIIGLTQSFQTIPASNGIAAIESSPQD